MLKYELVRAVEVSDWDSLVEETYGRVYSLQQQDGCKDRGIEYFTVPCETYCDYKNDYVPEVINGSDMGVSFKAWLERDPNQKVIEDGYEGTELFWQRNFYPSLQSVANDLYKKGLIEAGEYQIEIDW